MEHAPAFADLRKGGCGIKDGPVRMELVFMPNSLASTSQAKAELCAVINE